MTLHHTHDAVCPSCEAKLGDAHPALANWFRRVKQRYPNAHVSWSWRGQADQEKAVFEGKSKLHYPHSKHNRVGTNGKPCSEALDLFLLDEDGAARFPPLWYAKVNEENKAAKEPIAWAGEWTTFKETDHFEMSLSASSPQSAALAV